MERRLAAILAADVVGYSRLMEVDESATLAQLKAHREDLVDPAVCGHHGRIVKLLGDGLLAEFPSAVEAVRCAVEIQRAVDKRNAELSETSRIAYRIGINIGDIVAEDGDIFGDGVNVAARLEELAEPGGVCLSDSAYEHMQGKVDVAFEDMGPQALKNISRPVRVWHWTDGARTARSQTSDAAPSVPSGKTSLAVLPFVNMSESRAYEFLADGLAEDITTLLARIPGFLVIARNSSFAYKGLSPDVRDVARELGVRYIVEGSLRPVGDKLRITVQLTEAESGNHLWSERFDRPADSVEELQDEITLGIAARLEPELAKAEVEQIKRRSSDNLDAWSYFKQANGLLSLKGWHRETFEEAARLLDDAIALDPEFALAHAYLSVLLALGHMFGMSPEGENAVRRAIEEAERALEIDGRDPMVLGYSGCALCDIGQIDRGLDILGHAVEEDPSNAQAWVAMGTALLSAGKARLGVEMLSHGMRLSPLDNRLAYWGTNLAYALFRLHRTDEAEREARLACRRDDKLYMGRVVLAIILADQGRIAEAQQCVAEARRVRPGLSAQDLRALVGRRGIQILTDKGILT